MPQIPGHFLEGLGPGGLQGTDAHGVERPLLLHGHVGRTLQPGVLASSKHLISFLAQLLVFLPSDFVYGFPQTLRNMKPVNANLLCCNGATIFVRTDKGRPHIHAYTPNSVQLRRGQLLIPGRKRRFIAPDAHLQHRTRVRIRNNRQTFMPLPVRNFIHTDVLDHPIYSSNQSSLHRTMEDPMNRFPAKPQLPGDRQNARILGPTNHTPQTHVYTENSDQPRKPGRSPPHAQNT